MIGHRHARDAVAGRREYFIYFRLRKPDYTAEDVAAIATRTRELLAQGKDLYLMFKHEETAAGALNAERVLRKAGADSAGQPYSMAHR